MQQLWAALRILGKRTIGLLYHCAVIALSADKLVYRNSAANEVSREGSARRRKTRKVWSEAKSLKCTAEGHVGRKHGVGTG